LKAATAAASSASITADTREVYHVLWQLPALSPVPPTLSPATPGSFPSWSSTAATTDATAEQARNEAAYRQLLVRGVLAVLLPTEDLQNECLTSLVGQIFSELMIGNLLANKVAEPWFLWEGFSILSRSAQRSMSRSHTPNGLHHEAGGVRGHGAKASLQMRASYSWQALFWAVLRWGFFVTALLRFFIVTAFTWRSLPVRTKGEASLGKGATRAPRGSQARGVTKVPVLGFRIWPVLSKLIELNVRMPWLLGTLSMVQWLALTGPGQVAAVDGILDR
jgi:hypothetical protein